MPYRRKHDSILSKIKKEGVKLLYVIIVAVIICIVVKNRRKAAKEQEQYRLKKAREVEQLEQQHKAQVQEQELKEKKEKYERYLDGKRKEFREIFDEIIFSSTFPENEEFISTEEPAYKKFVSCKNESYMDAYLRIEWDKEYELFTYRIESEIKQKIKEVAFCENCDVSVNITIIFRRMQLLKLINNSNIYDATIVELENLNKNLTKDYQGMLLMVQPENNEYGNLRFILDSSGQELKPEDINTDKSKNDLDRIEKHFSELRKLSQKDKWSTEDYISLSNFLNVDDYKDSIFAMWGFATRKPFDVNSFERACKVVSWFKDYQDKTPSLETMVARIYNWKLMGGNNLVQEYSKDVMEWVENVSKDFSNEKTGEKYGSGIFYMFVSTLAWMELYDLELMVLKKLVELKVQLWENAQDRLTFLSSGGTANIKIYNEEEGVFSFDSSSVEWNDNELSVFFRKIKMKNILLKYSLVRKSWTKTYPLQQGQKYDADAIYAEFQNMIEDFDGEVKLTREKAVALNIKNLSYDDAMIFRFTSHRNQCTSMLFNAEKFGKNLNITILTLFTPEDNINIENLEQYAIAVKNNIYTESFREAILESLDTVLKIEVQAYENNFAKEESSEKKFSDFFD